MKSIRVASLPVVWLAAASLASSPPAHAQSFEVLHAFANPPGVVTGGLVLAPDGLAYGTTEYGGRYDAGTVFRVEPASGHVTVLHHFQNANDGVHPQASLVWGGDALYGTTSGAGPLGQLQPGTVFRFTLDGELQTLHAFSGADGSHPRAALVLAEGYLYGTTESGGSAGKGTVFRIGLAGGLESLHSFSGADGESPRAGLTLGLDGRLIGTTYSGGAARRGTIFAIDTSGGLSTLHSFSSSDGAYPQGEPFVLETGAVVGTTAGGGSGSGTVYRLEPGGALNVLHLFGAARGNPTGGLAQGPDGLLYGTTYQGALYRVSPAAPDSFEELHDFGTNSIPQGRLLFVGGDVVGVTAGMARTANQGTVFRYRLTDRTLTTLHRFSVTEIGWAPFSLTGGEDATLYGTTEWGGSGGRGTVFELTPAGARTAYAFPPFDNAWSNPVAQVTWGGQDLLYGARSYEGTTTSGSVFQLTPSTGERATLHSFSTHEGGTSPAYAPTVASDGNLWGTTSGGGVAAGGVIFRMGPAGSPYDLLYHFSPATGMYPSSPLLEGTDGNFYGVTSAAPSWDYQTSGCGIVFSVSRKTGYLNGVYRFPNDYSSGCTPGGSLAEGPGGRIYGTTSGGPGGFGKGVVFELIPTATPWNATIIHSFAGGADGGYPTSLVYAPDGYLYGAALLGSNGKGVVFRLRPDGTGYAIVHHFDGDDGQDPLGLIVGSDRHLYGIARKGGPGGGGVVFRVALAPTASAGGPYSVAEGGTVALVATGEDPAGGSVTFDWDLDGDGEYDDGHGPDVDFLAGPGHDGPGVYPVAVRVTAESGVSTSASAEVAVTNVAPSVQIRPSTASVHLGASVALRVSFVDPGPDTWTAVIQFGDGTTETRTLGALEAFDVAHVYAARGSYTVHVTVTDDDGAAGAADAAVTVRSAAQSIVFLIDEIGGLVADGTLTPGQGTSLVVKLGMALERLEAGDARRAVSMLEAFIHEVRGYEKAGTLTPTQADDWIGIAEGVIASISG
jgi:uncharacterized repeat protein (TIGR03803 family)